MREFKLEINPYRRFDGHEWKYSISRRKYFSIWSNKKLEASNFQKFLFSRESKQILDDKKNVVRPSVGNWSRCVKTWTKLRIDGHFRAVTRGSEPWNSCENIRSRAVLSNEPPWSNDWLIVGRHSRDINYSRRTSIIFQFYRPPLHKIRIKLRAKRRGWVCVWRLPPRLNYWQAR